MISELMRGMYFDGPAITMLRERTSYRTSRRRQAGVYSGVWRVGEETSPSEGEKMLGG
jgi:hypothetical protein